MHQHTNTADITAALIEKKQIETDQFTALEKHKSKLEGLASEDSPADLDTQLAAILAVPLITEKVEEYSFITLANRWATVSNNHLVENVESSCKALRAELKAKCKSKPILFASIGKRAAKFTVGMFDGQNDKDQLEAAREAAEDEAAEIESSIAKAVAQIRFFEVQPDEPSFTSALAAIGNVDCSKA